MFTTTDTERQKKINNAMAICSSIGFVAGLGYAFSKKKKFWGYVGYSLLFSVAASTAGYLGAIAVTKDKVV